jgi:hypothetical protein
MKDSVGLPMSVSVLAPAFRDATCLFAMKEIERLVQFQAKQRAYCQGKQKDILKMRDIMYITCAPNQATNNLDSCF